MSTAESPDRRSAGAELRIRADLIGLMFRLSRASRYLPFVVLLSLVTVFWGTMPHWQAAALVGAYVLGTAAFDWLRRAYARAMPPPAEAARWGDAFALLSLWTGGVWGAAGWLMFRPDQPAMLLFMVICLVLLATSSVQGRAFYMPAFFAFLLPLAAPPIIAFLLQGDMVSVAAGICGIAYSAALLLWARELHRTQREIVALRFENSELIERLSIAREEAEAGRQAAEAGNRAKSEFLAAISHELRTPMNGILGMSRLLLETGLTAQQRAFALAVRESGEGFLGLIDDVLDFSRLEANRIELAVTALDPGELIERVADLLGPRAHAKGLAIETYVAAAEVPAMVVADAARLRQILLHLIGNAIRFTDAGWVSCELRARGPGWLMFEITDTGVGIAEAQRPTLFMPFSQGGETTRRQGGTGLGLAICLRLVQAMGGEIGFDSEPGRGSRFWFAVPLPTAGSPARKAAAPLAFNRILLLAPDDRPRRLLARKLADLGAEVEAAGGLSLVPERGRAWDVAIVDDRVPDFAGGALLSNLRRLHGRDMRLVVAGTAETLEALAGNRAGPVLLLRKPLSRAELAALAPLPEPTIPVSHNEEAPAEARRPLRILVADDVPVNRRLLEGLLRPRRHEIDLAGDGLEALRAVSESSYDLVLMDVEMPRLNGIEAARRIRQLPGAAGQVPIVALTAHPQEDYLERCREAGMAEFIAKPVEAAKLYALIERMQRKPT